MDFFKKDSYLLGVVVGIVLPTVLYGLLFLIDMQFETIFAKHLVAKPDYLYLLSMIGNVFMLRYFYSRDIKEKAGAGVLLVTIVVVLLYFFSFYKLG